MRTLNRPELPQAGISPSDIIPDGWTVAPLKRFFRVAGGATPTSDPENWDGDIPWVTPGDLSGLDSFFIGKGKRSITERGYKSCGTELVPVGSVILSTRAPIGSLAIAQERLCTNQGCKALVPTTTVDARFFAYALSVATPQLNALGQGSTFRELSGESLGSFRLPVPSPQEQCRIAAFLDHETARIDELVREQERLQSLLAEKRDEVIGRAVREGLDGEESIPIGDVFIRSAPKSWQVSPLRRFLKHVSPRAVGEAWRDYTLLSLTRQGIIERDIDSGIGKFPAEFNGYQRVEPGQVVFCLFDIDETPRTVGYSDKRGMITSAYAVFEPTEYGNGEFISYYFQYVDTYKGLRPFYSGLRKTIRPNNFLGVRVAIPEVSEQERIVRFLDAELEKLDRLAEVAQRNIDLLLERRSALISAAVTGHLDLRDWQPSASERIAEMA